MFGKLKDKLKSLLGKKESSKDQEIAEAPKKEKKTKETPKKPTTEKKSESNKKLPTDEELKKAAQVIPKSREKIPQKFTTEKLKVEPELESLSPKSSEDTSQPEPNSSHSKLPSQPIDTEQDLPDKKGFFSKLKSKFTTSVISEEQVNSFFQELEIILLENNTALEVVDKIKENLKKDLVGISVKKGEIEKTIQVSLRSSIEEVLQNPPNIIEEIKKHSPPYTIIFFGINGTGKTTSIAKLAYKLKSQKISVALAAADTFRAAAIEQLETHAKKLKVPIIKAQYNADPTSVAFDALKYAEKHKIQCLLIDTAGRMYTKENLIKQMEKMIRVIKPNKKFFVGESIAGNDAIEQAKTFNEAVGIDGIILSKADVDEKGGTALSVSYITKKPIYYLGTGQEYKNLKDFNKKEILKNLGLD